MKKGNRTQLFLIGALVVVIVAMLIFSTSMTARINKVPEPTAVSDGSEGPIHFTGEVETLSGEVIESGIREMGELITAEYYYTHAEDFENVKTLWSIKVPMTKTKLVYTVEGDIKAGIDFTKVTVLVDDDAKKITITLPKSMVLASEIDHDSFHVVNEKEGWFNDLSAEDVNKTFAHVKEMEEEKAIENGLLTRADENAVRIITSFVKSSYDLKDYSVEVTE